VIGVLSLGRRADAPFTIEDIELLERLSERASGALANALSYQDAVQQARINRAVLDAAPDPIGLFGLDGEVVVENAPMSAVRPLLSVDPSEDPWTELRDELALGERIFARYV